MYTKESLKNRSLLSDILCTQAIGMSIEISWGDASKNIQQKVTLTSNVGHLQIQYYESQCKSEKMLTHLLEGTPHIFSSERDASHHDTTDLQHYTITTKLLHLMR